MESLISGPTANEFFLYSRFLNCGRIVFRVDHVLQTLGEFRGSVSTTFGIFAKLRHWELPNLAFLPNCGTQICQICKNWPNLTFLPNFDNWISQIWQNLPNLGINSFTVLIRLKINYQIIFSAFRGFSSPHQEIRVCKE